MKKKPDVETACRLEIEAALAKHECVLNTFPEYVPDGVGGFRTVVRISIARRK